jgi:hypothetical protein
MCANLSLNTDRADDKETRMSLAHYFTDPRTLVGQYLWRRTAHSATLARQANRLLAGAETLRPYDDAHYPWGIVAYAAPYLLRMAFPDFASRQTAAYHGAEALTLLSDLPYTLELREQVFDYAAALQGDAFRQPGDLARLSHVLGLFEEALRTPRAIMGPLFVPTPKLNVTELLAIPEPHIVADLEQIWTRFLPLAEVSQARPHDLFPDFGKRALAGSGHDPLLLDGELMLIKTTTTPKIDARWVRELLGYTLLDTENRHSIHTVSLYFARQGTRLTWPVERFAASLADMPVGSLARLRREFAYVRDMLRRQPAPVAATFAPWGQAS